MKILNTNNYYTNFGARSCKFTKAELEKYLLERTSIAEIARQRGITPQTVYSSINACEKETPINFFKRKKDMERQAFQKLKKQDAEKISQYTSEKLEQGVSLSDIAKQVGVSYEQLRKYLYISGLNFKKTKKDLKKQKILNMLRLGKTPNEIAEKVKMSVDTVNRYMSDMKKNGELIFNSVTL